MLLPYSIVDATVRRWPMVTFALIALNAVCFIGELADWRSSKAEVTREYRSAVAYQEAHPYLHAPPILFGRALQTAADRRRQQSAVSDDLSEADIEEEQAHLDQMCARLGEHLRSQLTYRFGFVPKDGVGLGIVTYMFLHGGVLHLLGNMWFLWLASSCIEDRWGRMTFALFYVASGIVAALAHMASNPQSMAPLLGASGAIAGCMGAFLVLFGRKRIRFFYLFGLRIAQFAAPAYLMLPAWLVAQVVFARFLGGESVAYWAHVGGFVFGASVAGVLRSSGLDERLEAWAAQCS